MFFQFRFMDSTENAPVFGYFYLNFFITYSKRSGNSQIDNILVQKGYNLLTPKQIKQPICFILPRRKQGRYSVRFYEIWSNVYYNIYDI